MEGQSVTSRGVVEYMRRLDALTIDDVIWTSYTDHRVQCEFDFSSLYSCYMRWKTMVARHLPKRCLRQYGYVQSIPRPVLDIPSMDIDWWFHSNIINSGCAIRDQAVTVQHPSQCEDGYLEWYLIVSHPHIIPPVEHIDDVEPSNARVPVNDLSSPPPPTTDVDVQ
ncbi:uncharacterized protein LOC127135886 [Lathyrus oleraceus]|uniref:uncharacterized protein LOC127135886 n=1 Tax=Pisum sativum TaxID=3888 RepID=UPI0021CFC73C|nr:uncharacterized protein LOC127135886 [Pisum sativum]